MEPEYVFDLQGDLNNAIMAALIEHESVVGCTDAHDRAIAALVEYHARELARHITAILSWES